MLIFSQASFGQKRLVILGDSLSEGYGVAKESAYPQLLEAKIKAAGKAWSVQNASISGSTSASGVSRLKWHLKNKPEMLILALGANDGLRGIAVEETRKNLAKTIELAQGAKIVVVLAGMMVPPNYGKDYATRFHKVFTELSGKYKIRLIPFLLEKVAGEYTLNQADGIHPNEKGHAVIAETVFVGIKDLL